MKRISFEGMNCSIARALEVVGEWWTLLVLREAFFGQRRFEAIQGRLGIARNVLAARLKALVAAGVLERRPYETRPPRYEYRLTPMGLALYPVIVTLKQWGDTWLAERGPPVLLVDRESGRPIDPVLVDRRTGRPLDVRATVPVAGPGARRETRKALATGSAGTTERRAAKVHPAARNPRGKGVPRPARPSTPSRRDRKVTQRARSLDRGRPRGP